MWGKRIFSGIPETFPESACNPARYAKLQRPFAQVVLCLYEDDGVAVVVLAGTNFHAPQAEWLHGLADRPVDQRDDLRLDRACWLLHVRILPTDHGGVQQN